MFVFRPHSAICALSLSIILSPISAVWAGPGDINSTNTNPVIQGGTYYNTPGSRTTFENDHGSLWLKSGSNIRALESDVSKNLTGNGGTVYFRAPNNVVRLDGDIDVSGLKNGQFYIGTGGKVFVDASYLYQNGNIFANGTDAGVVQFNVNSAVLGPTAKISAMGYGGYGGEININAKDSVSIAKGAILNSSGQVISTYDTNVINIEGGIVNNKGLIMANGTSLVDYRSPSSIAKDTSLVNHSSDLKTIEVSDPLSSKGGTIRLVALDKNGDVINTGTLQANGSQVSHPMQDVEKPGIIGMPEDGGTIILAANHDVINQGLLQANAGSGQNPTLTLTGSEVGFGPDVFPQGGQYGGHGGTVSVNALNHIDNAGVIQANGGQVQNNGGNGGLIAFSSDTMQNSGIIQANGAQGNLAKNGDGGQGGLIAFNETQNPTGQGIVQADGGLGYHGGLAGSVVAPNPLSFNKQQFFLAQAGGSTALGGPSGHGHVYQLEQNELLLNLDNGILLSKAGDNTVTDSLIGRLNSATLRTVLTPNGTLTDPLSATTGHMQAQNTPSPFDNLTFVGNFIIGSPNKADLHLDLGSIPLDPRFFNLNSSTFLTKGSIINDDAWIPGTHVVGMGFHDIYMNLGGGHLSWLAGKDIINNGYLLSRGTETGGSINMTAGQDIFNNRYMMTIPDNEQLLTGFSPERQTPGPGYDASHGGGFILNAGRDFINNGYLNNYLAFYPIHNVDTSLLWPKFLNGAQMGATIDITAGRNVSNNGYLSADAFTFRQGQMGLDSPANAIGGLINIQAGKKFWDNGSVSALGGSYYNSQAPMADPNQEVSYLHFKTLPGGTITTASQNGQINVLAKNAHISNQSVLP